MAARQRGWAKRLVLGLLIGLTVLVLALPSLVVQPIVRTAIRSALDLPEAGVSCEMVKTSVYWYRLLGKGADVRVGLRYLGVPIDVRTRFGIRLLQGPRAWCRAKAAVCGTDWQVVAKGDCGWSGWQAEVALPETAWTEKDPLLRAMLDRYLPSAVSNLVVSGNLALTVVASKMNGAKVMSWRAKVPVGKLSAEFSVGEKAYAVGGLTLVPAVSGLGGHVDVAPLFVRAGSVSAAGVSLTNLYAEVRFDPKDILISEAGAACFGGNVRLYALHLDPEKMSGGFSLYLENVEAGEVLRQFKGFKGDCSGPLNGKLSLFLTPDRRLRIRDAYLQSPSGAVGNLRLDASSDLLDSLSLAGLDDAARENLRRALTNLDYSVLKLDIRREKSKEMALNARIEGTARRGKLSAPVSLNITFRGDLEQLVNTGMKLTGKGKEDKQ